MRAKIVNSINSGLKSTVSVLKSKGFRKVLLLGGILGSTFVAGSVFADQNMTLSSMTSNIETGLTSIASLLEDISLIAGIGFVMASFFKLYQHKNNPQQVPMSNGLTMMGIGAALCLFPVLLPTASSMITGKTDSMSRLGGSSIQSLISNTGA